MNSQRSIKLAAIALAAAAMLFAGCAKKEVVSDTTGKPVGSEGTAQQNQGEFGQMQSGSEKPSTNSVYFAFDMSDLDASAQATLDAYASYLNANLNENITIEGNCDERGSREYNLALGQRRADSVKDYLVTHGVAADRIDTVSFGEEKPVCTGSGEACWAQNRRADIR